MLTIIKIRKRNFWKKDCSICADCQEELSRIAAEVLQTAKNCSKHLSIEILNMKRNHVSYSKFLLAKQLMQKEFHEYIIIMIDDDEYIYRDTITG